MSRQLGASPDVIEAWDIDKFLAYRASLARVMKAQAPKKRGASR